MSVVLALTIFGAGGFGLGDWLRNRWRARNDNAVDHHPMAVALRALGANEPGHITRERIQAAAIAERLRTRQVVAESEFFDIEAMWAGEQSRCEPG